MPQTSGPKFRPFRTTMSRFWVTAQLSQKCTEWPQITLTCSRSKIPTCMLHTPKFQKWPYLGMTFGHWPHLHIYSLSASEGGGGRIWGYFRAMVSGFRNKGRFSKLPYLGRKLGNWPKCQELHIFSPLPMGLKLSLFSLYEQQFPRYGPIFKISHIWMDKRTDDGLPRHYWYS